MKWSPATCQKILTCSLCRSMKPVLKKLFEQLSSRGASQQRILAEFVLVYYIVVSVVTVRKHRILIVDSKSVLCVFWIDKKMATNRATKSGFAAEAQRKVITLVSFDTSDSDLAFVQLLWAGGCVWYKALKNISAGESTSHSSIKKNKKSGHQTVKFISGQCNREFEIQLLLV